MRDYDSSEYANTASIMATVSLTGGIKGFPVAVSYPHVSIVELGDVESHNSLMLRSIIPRELVQIPMCTLSAKATGVAGFGLNGEYAVLKLESPDIETLREQILELCQSRGIVVPESKFEYSPHVSLGVLEGSEELPEFTEDFEIHLTEVTLFIAGDVVKRIPLF